MQIVEVFTCRITVCHDKVKTSSLYMGDIDLDGIVRDAWPMMLGWFGHRDGKTILADGGVVIEWSSTGLTEEVEEGDN